MKKKMITFLLLILLVGSGSLLAETSVTYISSEGIYINAGTNAELHKNDTLRVYRGEQKIALVKIANISSRSSACTIIELFDEVKIGDLILNQDQSSIIVNDEQKKNNEFNNESKKVDKKLNYSNRIRGYVAFQQYYQKDFTSSSLSSYQPSLITKFKIENINGSNLTFQFKHRSRYYHRSKQITYSGDKNNWSHRIYEFVVFNSNEQSRLNWSFGRQSIYQVRGIGYIDGLYLSHQLSNDLSIGTALGSEPDYLNQKIDFKKKKGAFFINYSKGDYSSRRISLSAAFAGSYLSGEVNREFLNFSADYFSPKLSINNAVEVDLYRSWRKDALGESISFSNYYGRINYNVSEKIRINFSYDNRHQIRYHDDVHVADSLFDNNDHQGLRLGSSFKLSQNMTFNSHFGIRFRSDDLSDNKFVNTGLTIMRFPNSYNSLSIRFAYVNTMFTNAYRPSVSFRFPIKRKIYLTLRGSSNIYKSGGQTTTNSYVDLNSYYTMSNSIFMSGSLRQYLDSNLKSSQLFFEIGKNL